MNEKLSSEALFLQLVLQNQQMALMSMGKIKNPLANKIDVNLELAKITIDTLDMLAEKTKGNLSEYEDKLLTEVLKDLKINYVEQVDKEVEKTDKNSNSGNNTEDAGQKEK